jgi:Amino acid permease
LAPFLLKWTLTLLLILAPPAGDAFSFVVDLTLYPTAFFNFIMAIGLYLVRHRRKKLGLVRQSSRDGGFRAWEVTIIFTILVNLFQLVMPWYPPPTGPNGGDVSFWYATYVVTGIGMYVFYLLLFPENLAPFVF